MDRENWCRKIDMAYNSIKEPLILAFTEFYGKEYQDTIRFVVENLVIIKLCKNLSNEELDSRRKDSLHKLNKVVKDIAISMGFNFNNIDSLKVMDRLERCSRNQIKRLRDNYPKLDEQQVIKAIRLKTIYDYYNISLKEKINDTFPVIVLGVNDAKLTKYETARIVESLFSEKGRGMASAYTSFLYPIIDIRGPVLDIHALIHEINHLLKKKVELDIPINSDLDKRDRIYGTNNYYKTNDLFYEFINEFMAKDIHNIFNKYYEENDNYILVNSSADNDYLVLNQLTNGIVEKIYIRFKEVIKKILIEDGKDKFIEIIDLKKYSRVSGRLKLMYYDVIKKVRTCKSISEVLKLEVNPIDIEVLNTASDLVCNQLEEYQQTVFKSQDKFIR